MRKLIIAAVTGVLLVLGFSTAAQATEQPFVAYDTAAGGAQTASTVSAVTADAVTLVQDGRATANAGTSAETSNLGVEVAAGETVTVNYELTDGADFASGAVRLFIFYSPDADTWNDAPDQVATAAAASGTLSITADGGTIGTAGVVYDTSNPSEGTATFTGLSVAGEPASFLPAPDPEPEPEPDPDPTDDPKTEPTDDPKPTTSEPAAVPTSIPAGKETLPDTGVGLPLGLAAVVLLAGGGALALRRRLAS